MIMPDQLARQTRATEAWVQTVMYHNPEMPLEEAQQFVADLLAHGHDTVITDLVTLQDKPHHITYRWNDVVRGGHWCPGYYDCLACYPD